MYSLTNLYVTSIDIILDYIKKLNRRRVVKINENFIFFLLLRKNIRPFVPDSFLLKCCIMGGHNDPDL